MGRHTLIVHVPKTLWPSHFRWYVEQFDAVTEGAVSVCSTYDGGLHRLKLTDVDVEDVERICQLHEKMARRNPVPKKYRLPTIFKVELDHLTIHRRAGKELVHRLTERFAEHLEWANSPAGQQARRDDERRRKAELAKTCLLPLQVTLKGPAALFFRTCGANLVREIAPEVTWEVTDEGTLVNFGFSKPNRTGLYGLLSEHLAGRNPTGFQPFMTAILEAEEAFIEAIDLEAAKAA